MRQIFCVEKKSKYVFVFVTLMTTLLLCTFSGYLYARYLAGFDSEHFRLTFRENIFNLNRYGDKHDQILTEGGLIGKIYFAQIYDDEKLVRAS